MFWFIKYLPCPFYLTLFQCSINAFCGLLPSAKPELTNLQEVILDALYIMATFHSLAKLRMHSTRTLELLDDVTEVMGAALRNLRNVSSKALTVMELPRDVQARVRNQQRRLQKQAAKTSAAPAQKKVLTLNLNTIKTHLLEHYRNCVEAFGTTDSYSTSIVR
jgi:hypothetical protein